CSRQPPFHFPPERAADLVSHFRPAHSDVLQLAIAHGGKLTTVAAILSPGRHQHEHRSRDCKQGNWKWPPVLPPAFCTYAAQWRQPAASLRSCGNGPSTRSTSAESQYSLISLILPFSMRHTMQYWLS